MDALRDVPTAAVGQADRRPRGAAGVEGARSRGSEPPRMCPTSRSPGKAGRIRRCRRSVWASTCARCARCSTATATARRPVRPFRPGLRAHAHRLRPGDRRRASRKYRAFIERGGGPGGELWAARSRANTATASPRPSCCHHVRRRSDREAIREFKAIWDPGRMNPGKVSTPTRVDENLRLGTAYAPPRPATRTSPSPPTGRFSPRDVALRRRRRVPQARTARCARATWPPAKRCTARADARACCSRCCAATVDGVLRRRLAQPAVKQSLDLCLSCKGCKRRMPGATSTWPATRRSSCRTTTRHAAPAAAYAFG
jgi:hypothetical protein